MEEKPRFDLCSLLEGIDRCESLEQLSIFAILGLGGELGCFSGAVQEVIHRGGTAKPGRSFVSEGLQQVIDFFHVNFDIGYASLLRDRKKSADPNVDLLPPRIRDALELNFDPRSIWVEADIGDILMIKVPYGPTVDLHLMFNRKIGAARFCERDLWHARLIAPMLSATSRRLHAEESLCLPRNGADAVEEVANFGTVHYGRKPYLLSRCRGGSLMRMGNSRLLTQGAQLNRLGESDGIIFVKPCGAESPLGALTKCERTIAGLVVQGLSNKEIARAQAISVYTVENHLKSIYRKLDLSSRTQLAPLLYPHLESQPSYPPHLQVQIASAKVHGASCLL